VQDFDPFLPLADLAQANRILHCLDFSLLPRNEDRSLVIASRGQFANHTMEGLEYTPAEGTHKLIHGNQDRKNLSGKGAH
jgi:hypothetical protein